MKIIVTAALVLLWLAALSSVIAWSAFDLKWWAPMSEEPNAREFILCCLHGLVLIGAPSALMLHYGED